MTLEGSESILNSFRPNARLIVKKGPQAGIVFPLIGDRIILGREEACDIVVRDAEVSRRHIQITWEDDIFMIQDLGSTNGSFLNGTQLSTPTPLSNGNSIGLGQTSLRFEIDSQNAQDIAAVETANKKQKKSSQQVSVYIGLGCGCLIMFCVCSTLGLVALDWFDFIDLGLGIAPPG